MRPLLVLCSVCVVLAGCGGGGTSGAPASGPSGSLGIVTAGEAAEAVSALCDLRDATDRDQANAQFFDRAHQTLHVLAAATEVVDRVPAAGLLEAMQGVEADLQADALPQTFAADVGGLLDATRRTLRTDDLPAPAC